MPILSEGGYTGPGAYTLQKFCEEVREINRLGRVVELRMNSDAESNPSPKVGIMAANLLDNNAKSPARKGTPGPAARTGNTEARICIYCNQPVQWGPDTTWADHDCPAKQCGRPSSPSTCQVCRKPRKKCTCDRSRSRSRDRWDSRGRSHERNDLQDTNVGNATSWVPHPPTKERPNDRQNKDRGGGHRRTIGHGRASTKCTLLASLLITASVPGTLAMPKNFADHIPTIEPSLVGIWSLIVTAVTVSTMTSLIGVRYQCALVFLPSWVYQAHQSTSTVINNTNNAAILLMLAAAMSALTLSPFLLHRCHKTTALFCLVRLLSTTTIMATIDIAILGCIWVSYLRHLRQPTGPTTPPEPPLLLNLPTPTFTPPPPPGSTWNVPSNNYSLRDHFSNSDWNEGGLSNLHATAWPLGIFLAIQMFAHHMCLRIHSAAHASPIKPPKIPRRAYIMALMFILTLL